MIFSLGTHCYTAHVLKQLDLGRKKSPFDWLFSRPVMIAHCLDDNFSTFLDAGYYRHVPVDRRGDPNHGKCSHIVYDSMTLEPIFNHHDPLIEQKDRDYFEQTIDNLRSAPQDVVKFFIMITVWPADIDVYKKIASALAFVGNRKILILNVREGHEPTEAHSEYASDLLDVVSFYPRSHLDGISFGDAEDDLDIKSIVTDWLSRSKDLDRSI